MSKLTVQEQLIRLGFSDKEALVYLYLLEVGSASATQISVNTGIHRTTVYLVVSSLLDSGYIYPCAERGAKRFCATRPELIIYKSESQASKAFEILTNAKSLLPELQSLYNISGNKMRVSYLEGDDGLRYAYEDTLTSTETILAYASIDDMHNCLPDYFPEYYKRRAKRKINIRSIHPDTEASRERVKNNKLELRDSRLIPKEQFTFTAEIMIYGDKICFISLQEKYSLILKSKEMADVMKVAFELSWIGASVF